jgi:serine O-acetyltransferase
MKKASNSRRGVCIYANATILGGTTVIGRKRKHNWRNAWVTKSIPAKSMVLNTTTTEVKIKEIK